MTSPQLFPRLLIFLGQKKTGNNSEKLKNEIRKLFILCTYQKNYQK